jgi:uncharacterized membrane protein YkvA (DUF1232 family)
MNAIFSFLSIIFICLTALAALFLVLLALPQSRLRSNLLEVLGWTGVAASTSLILSPVDFIPDMIPVVGQADDLVYLLCAIASFWMAWKQRAQRNQRH